MQSMCVTDVCAIVCVGVCTYVWLWMPEEDTTYFFSLSLETECLAEPESRLAEINLGDPSFCPSNVGLQMHTVIFLACVLGDLNSGSLIMQQI